MSWYNDWFNSINYLKVYSHRDVTEAEKLVELIINKLNLQPGCKVLDMACGSGRHAIIFAQKGFDVTAVDLSKNLITAAEKNAAQSDVKINFVLSDILDFNSPTKFQVALNLFTSIGYFEDDEDNFQVIIRANELLDVGGFFVLDYFNKNYLVDNLIPTSVYSDNGSRITQNRFIEGNRIRKNITFEYKGSVEEFYESVRLYSYEEIKSYLSRAGFKILYEFGDYSGNIFNKETSQRLILFAKK